MRKQNQPSPDKPLDENDVTSEKFWTWIGYRVQLANDFLERKKAAEMCGAPVPELAE
jgi:hypothetical protein